MAAFGGESRKTGSKTVGYRLKLLWVDCDPHSFTRTRETCCQEMGFLITVCNSYNWFLVVLFRFFLQLVARKLVWHTTYDRSTFCLSRSIQYNTGFQAKLGWVGVMLPILRSVTVLLQAAMLQCLTKRLPKPVGSRDKPLALFLALPQMRNCCLLLIKLPTLHHPRCGRQCLQAGSSSCLCHNWTLVLLYFFPQRTLIGAAVLRPA